MDKPEIKGFNALACIADPIFAAGVAGLSTEFIIALAASCNVAAVATVVGIA